VHVVGEPGGDEVVMTSDDYDRPARVPLSSTPTGVASVQPPWARFAAGVVAE